MQPYRLFDPAAAVPVPALGGALFPSGSDGMPVDPADPFFARLIREGSIVPAQAETETPAATGSKRKG